MIVHAFATDADQTVAHVNGGFGGLSWSPDGSRLAYTTNAGSTSQVHVASMSGGSATVTTTVESGPVGAPSWTPDGANLIYSTGGGGGGPIQHLSSPPEIGAKLIFVATEGGAAVAAARASSCPRRGRRAEASAAAGGGGRRWRRGGGGAWLDATHLTGDAHVERRQDAHDRGGRHQRRPAEGAARRDRGQVLQRRQQHGERDLAGSTSGCCYTATSPAGIRSTSCQRPAARRCRSRKAPGEHWRAVWSHDSRRIALGREHAGQARHATDRGRDDRRRSGARDDRRR